jgi:hypothetical protein
MTALEIVVVTAALLVNGCLAVSDLRIDFSQRSRMKRLVAEGYARLRAARSRRRRYRRADWKRKLGKLSRDTAANAQRPASKQQSRRHRKMLRHRAERQRRKEGEPADNHDHAGQQGDEKDSRCWQGPGG